MSLKEGELYIEVLSNIWFGRQLSEKRYTAEYKNYMVLLWCEHSSFPWSDLGGERDLGLDSMAKEIQMKNKKMSH